MNDDRHERGTGRERALRAAHELFAEKGYEATSIQDVIAASHLSRGALYHHFAGKAELFTAVLEEVEEELFARLAAGAAQAASYREAVRSGALGFLEQTLDPAVRRIVLVDAPAALGWARWREIDGRYAFGAMRAALQGAIESGELNLDLELAESYTHILLAALMEMGLLMAQADDLKAAHELAARSIERLLDDLWSHAS
jgi:AcrR family transcriptional regulator